MAGPIPIRSEMAAGFVGTWANMEERNARSMFAESNFTGGVPLALGDAEMNVVPLTTGKRFIGISLTTVDMYGPTLSDGSATFRVGDLLGVADMGTVFVLAGEGAVEGANVFYDAATRKFHGASAAGRLPLPDCEFDTTAADGSPVALRIRIVPGSAAVEAAE